MSDIKLRCICGREMFLSRALAKSIFGAIPKKHDGLLSDACDACQPSNPFYETVWAKPADEGEAA